MDDKAKRELTSHIREHVSYPITKKSLVEACSNMAHVPAETREWAAGKLPDQTYASADQVLKTLGL
jgi:hypothetical protein